MIEIGQLLQAWAVVIGILVVLTVHAPAEDDQ